MNTVQVLKRGDVMRYVPCNGCKKCCHGDAVRILPHEDVSQWKTEKHPYMPGARMLAHHVNGDCVYLGENGCTIQETKPQQCKEMDCRLIASKVSWTKARKLDAQGALSFEVWRKGRDLIKASKSGQFKLAKS